MNTFLIIIGLLLSIGLSSLFLIERKKGWCSNLIRFGITGFLFIIGLIGILMLENLNKSERLFFIWIQIPLINTLVDRTFRFLSLKLHKRDLLLYIRGSSDLDFAFKNSDFKTSDYIFSTVLIILIFILPIIGL